MKHIYQFKLKPIFNSIGLKHVAFCMFFFAFSYNSFAQTTEGQTTVVVADQFGVTRPLSEIFKENPVPEDLNLPKADHPDKKRRTPQSFPLAKEGDPVFGNSETSIQREPGDVPGLPVRANWTGQTPAGGFRPYDPSGAIGPNHYIQMINSTTFRVYDKVSGANLLTGTLGNLWTPATGNSGDPIVMYDKPANRWFMAQFGTGNKIYIAISQTASPLGSWYTYTFTSPQFPDYLKFGIWHDAYYMTSNQGTQKVFAFNRAELLAGTPTARSISVVYAPPIPAGFFCPLPADAGDGTLPAAGTPCPILSYSDNGWGAGFNDAVNIYNMSVNWVPATPTASITFGAAVPTAAFNANYNPSWNDCVQPGTAQKLDGIGGVLMYRSQWKSWPGYNSLVLNWGVEISATQRGIKWCELRQSGGVWSMYQEGIFSPGGDTRWMGSIAMNDAGAIGLCYIRSNSSTMFPSLYYTGRRSCDPLGTLPVTETLVAAGTGSQTTTNRVGDYSHMTIDPSNGTTFWATSEFMGGATGGSAARTQVFSFDIASCATASVSISISSGSNPTCGSQMVTFTASPTNGGTAPTYQWQINGTNVGVGVSYSSSTLSAGDVVTCIMTSNLPGVTGSPATSNAITMAVNTAPTLGTATIFPSAICLGETTTITYTPPTCEVSEGFQNEYAPANWTLAQVNSNGSVTTTLAPASISMVSSNGLTGAGQTNYSITVPCSGNITFDWNYSTIDGALYDYPTYFINGGSATVFPGYLTSGGITQTGTATIPVNAGDVITFQAYSTDNSFGPCTIVISNFSGPVIPNQHFDIFDAATGGNLLGWSYTSTLPQTPAAAGTFTYYVAAHSNFSGCYSVNRQAVSVIVNPVPTVGTASIAPSPICLGSQATITYTPPACESIIGFQNVNDPANWTLTQSNSNGVVNTAGAPFNISMTSSNGMSIGAGNSNYSIPITCSGTITFDWNYTTVDGAVFDYPRYTINGGTPVIFPGYSTSGGTSQSGNASIAVNAGDVFALQAYSADNVGGPCTIVINNFNSPSSTNQHFDIFDTPTLNNLLGWSYTSTLDVTPSVAGYTSYYVAAHDNNTGCYSSSNVPVTVLVNPLPVLGTAAASPTPICIGQSTTLTYTPLCAANIGFQAAYAPANWTATNTNSNGSVDASLAPSSISMVSSNGLTGSGQTDYAFTVACAGNITFNWDYATIDGAYYDYPMYSINGGAPILFTGYSTTGLNNQTGTESIAVNAGDVFKLIAFSLDNFAGPCTTVISNFSGPAIPVQSVTWYDAASGGSIIGFGNPFLYTPPVSGSFTCYAQINDLNCTNPIRVATNSFTVNALPNVTCSASSATICEGASTTLTGANALTYAWNPGSLSGTSVTVSPSSTTIYSVVGTDGNGCTKSSSIIIYVNPTPTLGTATATPATFCLGASTSLAYTPPSGNQCNGAYQTGFAGTYAPANWTTTNTNSNGSVNTASAPGSISMISSNGLFGSGFTNYNITVPCTGIVTFNWSYTSIDGAFWDNPRYSINGSPFVVFPGYNTAGSQTQSGTFTQLVNAGQVLTLQAYSVDNAGGSCTITINNFSAPYANPSTQSITWFNAPTGGTNLGSGNPLSHTPITTGTFGTYAQVTNTVTGCTNTVRVATNPITVNPLPTANAGVDKSLTCTTPSTTIGTAAVTGNTYAWSPATGLSATNIAVPTTTALVTTTYTVTVTTGAGCTATDVVVVTVNKTPPTANAGSDLTLTCASPSSAIGTAAIAGNTYAWSPATALSSATAAQPTCTATATTTYTVTVTGTNGCIATDVVLVTVNKTPPTANAGVDKTLTCTTPSSTIGTAAVVGNTYAWSPSTGLSSISLAQPTSTATATTTYTVTVTGTNGCTASDAVLVTVNKTPPTANAGADITLTCTTPSSAIGTAAVVGNTYAWSPATGLSSATAAQPTTTATATTTYTVTVTGANGCTASDAILVTVNKTPPTANAGVDKTLTCTTPSSTIGTAGVVGNTYVWSPATGLSSATTAQPTSSATATTTYTVTVTGANGCTASDAVLVTVNKTPPSVGTTATSTSIACGASTNITGTGAVSYTWQPGSLSGTTITVSPTTTTTYTVTGTGSNGCTATSTRLITVGPCGSTVNVKVYIQGYYLGGGLMDKVMENQSVAGATSTQTDTITVQLRNATFPYGVAATQKRILNTNGTSTGNFAVSGNYYIVVKHRNGLETWSANPVAVSGTVSYDFSNLASKAYGSNQVALGAGIFGIYSGDIEIDENIDLLDLGLLETDISNFVFGYFPTDINGDGNVDLLDSPTAETNVNSFIFSIHP